MTTRQARILHKQFLTRHSQYERRYARRFLTILSRQYREAAAAYPEPYTVNQDDYRPVYEQLYHTIIPAEASQAWADFVRPLTADQKDFFDDLASILGFSVPEGEFIRIWRDIAREWTAVNILTRIREVSQTTQRAIAKVIERAINEGSSVREISRAIQAEARGEINRNRSVLIARTETIGAMNRGRRLSMYTSNLLWNKQWIDTPDNRTRMSHRAISREDPRPLDEPYWLITPSGTMEPANYPGDPQLSAANVINCRCTEVYEVQRDAAGRPIRRNGGPIQVQEALEVIA